MFRRCFLLSLLVSHAGVVSAQALPQAAAQKTERPYVVLVSMDGFRFDYAQRYQAKNILDLARIGASAEALIPSFPSVTFPNHISLVTGKYPGNHGILANDFYDPARNASYSLSKTATDGSWYRAKPIWIAAEEQGVKAAAMFWPTSDAEIAGRRPSYWSLYDEKTPDEERVNKVLEWLRLPAELRPHLITLYFSDADDAGHHNGPEAEATRTAVTKLDRHIGELWRGLQASGLPVNLILVSDHGMQAVQGVVNLSDFADLSRARVINAGTFSLLYTPDAAVRESIYRALHNRDRRFQVYRTNHTPRRWHYQSDPRMGDLIVVARQAIEFSVSPRAAPVDQGRHGYDPGKFSNMRGVFYAAGPNILPGARVKPFVNVNVYAFIARVLGLTVPPDLDGDGKMLERIRRK